VDSILHCWLLISSLQLFVSPQVCVFPFNQDQDPLLQELFGQVKINNPLGIKLVWGFLEDDSSSLWTVGKSNIIHIHQDIHFISKSLSFQNFRCQSTRLPQTKYLIEWIFLILQHQKSNLLFSVRFCPSNPKSHTVTYRTLLLIHFILLSIHLNQHIKYQWWCYWLKILVDQLRRFLLSF